MLKIAESSKSCWKKAKKNQNNSQNIKFLLNKKRILRLIYKRVKFINQNLLTNKKTKLDGIVRDEEILKNTLFASLSFFKQFK